MKGAFAKDSKRTKTKELSGRRKSTETVVLHHRVPRKETSDVVDICAALAVVAFSRVQNTAAVP